MNILVKNNSVEEINAALLRLTRSFKNEQTSLQGKVTNIISGSSKANGNEYNDSLLRQMIKALQDLTTDHTKQINSLTEEQNTFNKKIQSITTMLGNINWSYDPESRIATYIDKDGKAKTWEIKDTTYTFSFDDETQTLTIHDDTQTKVNPNWDPNDPDSPQYIPDDTNDFVQQITGATYTFTWSNGSLTIHNNLSTTEHPIADVVIDFDGRYYTEDEIDAFITSLDNRLDAIEEVIPSEATANNKLADKAWVATAISISAATFRGTFNSLADLQAYAGPKDANDFAFVKTSTGYDQYTWVPSGSSGSWTYEFSLETLSGTLSVQAISTDTRVYPTGTTMCSGCDNVTTLCGAPSTLFFNPANGSYNAQKYGTNTGCCCDTGGITAKFGTSVNQDLNVSLTTASGNASGVGYGELEISTNANHGFKYNPYTGQMTLPQIVLNPDETYSGAYSGGIRINRTDYDAGHSAWAGVMIGGARNSVCACTNLWWMGTNWSETSNSHGNDGKLFLTYEGAASDNQRRGYFEKSNGETLWRGNASGIIYKDAEFVNWQNIDLSALDENTIYPIIFALRGDNSITHIRIRNALDGGHIPSWATHTNGFSAELDMYDQPNGWGAITSRRYVKQASLDWVNVSPENIWGYSQLTHTSIGVLWLRGGAVWKAWNSVDTGFTVITWTYDDGTGDTVAPTTPGNQPSLYTSLGMSYDTVSNAINASCAYWSCCTDSVCLYNLTDSNSDYEIPTVVNATPGAWSSLGITCYNCGKPTWNPVCQTLKAPRIVADSFGFNNVLENGNYSSIVPYICILPQVNNQPLYVRICFLQDRNLAGGHFHISHWQFDATINLDQGGEQSLAYYCGATYGTSYFSIPSYACCTQYMWLYFADSWWSPRISADIPFCVDTYRSTSSAQDAEIANGGGWHTYTDLRNSGGSVDNATCFNGYTWACACAIFTGSITPYVRCDNAWFETLGIDSNGNAIKQGCITMVFNPGTRMNAMCSITTNPVTGNYTEGIRLNRSNNNDSWTALLIGDCYGTYCGNCDGIFIGRNHSAANNQKLFFTWRGDAPAADCGYMYFPTAGYGACWCGNVYGYANKNIGSFLGEDYVISNTGDWHKMVTNSGLSGGQWQHVLNLNWVSADNEWTSRLYLPTNYMTSCKHMYFSTNGNACTWEVLDNGADTQYKTGGLNASWFATAGITSNKQTGTLSCGTTYYIHLYDINWGSNAYRGTVDVDYSIYGSGVVDSINLRASSNGYDNSLESMGVCLNRTSYGGQNDPTGASGLVGIGFIHSTTYSCALQVWGKFVAYDNYDYTQYLGMNLVNTRSLSWYGNEITTTSPSFTCFVCVKPSGQKAFHWFNGEVDGVISYAENAGCSNFAFAACCATSISVPVCCVTVPAGCKDNYIRLTTTASPRGTWNIYDSGSTFKVSLDRGNTAANLSWCRRTDSQLSFCSSMLLGASLGYTSSASGLLVRVSTLSGCASSASRTFYIAYEDETGQKAPPETPTLVCCSGWNLDEHCFISDNLQFTWDNCMNEYYRSQRGQCICAISRLIIPVGVTSNVNGSIWIE